LQKAKHPRPKINGITGINGVKKIKEEGNM
jgi:hypothetical protein